MQRLASPRPRVASPLARLATQQYGVVARRQLHAIGVTEGMTQTLVARGHLIRIHHGVFAVGHARLSLCGRWMAAVLACGDAALLSHAEALALHGCARAATGAVHVTARFSHRVPGVRCHVARERLALGATAVGAIPVTSLERAVLDCAPQLSRARLVGVLEAIERRDRFDRRRFEVVLARSNGHRGVGRLRAALAMLAALGDDPPALRSGLERRMLELIREAGLPEPSVNVVAVGEVVDLRWPGHGVIVEIDSWDYHRSRRAFEEDRRRGNALVLSGETLLRMTDRRINASPTAVISEVSAALARRGAWG